MGKTKAKRAAPAQTEDQAEHPLLSDFAADVPHEAASGEYSFNCRDRWFGQPTDLGDGWHPAGDDWMIRVEGGLPQEALREDHPRALAVDYA